MQPKRLITLNARTDPIAERIKRSTKYGFSAWVRHRLTAWDRKQKHGYPEEPEVEILRLERRLGERRKLAWRLASLLSKGERSWVGENPDIIIQALLDEQKLNQTSEEVVY